MSLKANNGAATLSEILASHDSGHENCRVLGWGHVFWYESTYVSGTSYFIIGVLEPYEGDTENRVEKCGYKNTIRLINVRSEEFFFFCSSATHCGWWPPHSWGFLGHTQRRNTVGRTPLYEWSARRKGRTPAEIVGSNPTGGMDICLLWLSCVVR